jgi:cell surface protein SprA
MAQLPTKNSSKSLFSWIIVIAVLCHVSSFAQSEKSTPVNPAIGLHYESHYSDPLVDISEDNDFMGMHMGGARSPFIKPRVPSLKREVAIDSTGKNITFTEKIGDIDFRTPRMMPLFNYVSMRRRNYMRDKFVQTSVSRLDETFGRNSGGGAIRIDIPVEIKSKAFQKIFGGGTVGLDVTGEINIKGGFRNEKRSQVKTALTRGSDNSFKMEQTQKFNVSGHVGDKVTIRVDQDSERTFDFENNIKLEYKGYEDEIIQTIEAGNISLSLPGTRFVTSGVKSAGLFGIKTSAQIGNLKLVAVASQEKGEKKKLSLKGGASDETKELDITRYKRGAYFFLDTPYRNLYEKRTDDGTGLYDAQRVIRKIEVYKSAPNYQQQYPESIRGFAYVPAAEDTNLTEIALPDTNLVDGTTIYRGNFLRLEKDQYYYDDLMGYIRTNTALQDGEVLAVAYRDTSGRVRGKLNYDVASADPIYLRLLKTKEPRPSDPTWPLEWKNVYALGGRNISEDGFEFRIFYQPPSGDPQETVTDANGNKITWLQAFGLDRKNQSGDNTPDNIIDNNPMLINRAMGEIYFPHLRPFDPKNEYLRALLESNDPKLNKLAPAIYDTTVQSAKDKQAKFYLDVKSQNKSAEYSLGMNVIDGSEEVTLNGRTLMRNVDYTIDYMFGRLVVLNEQALAANANLDISYESNQLFQIDKKTVMGLRAEYGLWDESFIGATFMYLNETTLDQKIRVGKGPMRNMIWDVNTSMTMKPFFLTKMANFLPFVDTRQPSTIKFEGEIAQILPNPNTQNFEKTGDNDGVAYIDDFEASKRVTPLPIVRRGWIPCAPPLARYPSKNFSDLSDRGHMIHYNPYGQTFISEIWPNKDVNANVAQTTNILVMKATPSEESARPEDSWYGIQRSLSSGYSNQTEAKYLEIMVHNNPSTTATMHIDLGQISEDIIPNKSLDTEDKVKNGLRNGLLDEGEDIGLDGMSNGNASAIAAGEDFWDLDKNGVRDPGEPFSRDDWAYSPTKPGPDGIIDYSKVNGTEGNQNDSGGRVPDTEDMNGNGDVDLRNDYFHFAVNMNHNHEDYENYVIGESIDEDTGFDSGWRLYQIPLNAFVDKEGSPDLSLVEYIRVWFDGFGSTTDAQPHHKVRIAEINLVGSDWKEQGVATKEQPEVFEKDDETFVLSVVNTHENVDYRPPPGVEGEVDRITRVIAKEQALVMRINGLFSEYATKAEKTFYDAQDYIHYNTLKMFVYGKDDDASHIKDDSSSIDFYFRFGADENNYYEIRQPVYQGWHKNSIEIDLTKMAQLKITAKAEFDSLTGSEYYREYQPDGTLWTVRGKPALRNIKILQAGVFNMDKNKLFTGEVWLNELRLSNVKKDKGIAMRARMDFAWADLLRVNGEINQKDADFHNVGERFGTGDNKFSGQFGANVNIDKFLPAKLGIAIPVSVNYSKSESTPKYMPGSDIEVTDALPDTTLEQIRNYTEKRGMSASFGFNTKSQNFVVKNIIRPFKASYSRNEGKGSNSRTEYSKNKSESGSASWGIVFGRNNFVRPFKFLEQSKYAVKLSDMKLYYSPQSFTTKIAGSRSASESMTRSGVLSENSTFKITRGMSGNMKFIESLTLDMSRNYTNDLRDMPDSLVWDNIKSGDLGELTNVDQNTTLKFNPKIFAWFTTNFNYNVNFRYAYNRQQKISAKSATQGGNMSAGGNLNLSTLMKTIYKPKGGAARRSKSAPARRPPGEKKDGAAKPGKKKESNFRIMGIVTGFVEMFDPFNVKYATRNNMTKYGLVGMPVTGFQLGLTEDPGVANEILEDGASTSAARDSRSENETFAVSSGLKFGRNVTLGLNYDKLYSLNQSTTATGQRSQSWYISKNDSTGMMFPTWNLRVSGLEKFPFLKNWFQRISLEHARSGKANQTFTLEDGSEIVTKEDRDTQFRPLIGVTIQMKNSISFNIRYNVSNKETITKTSGQAGTRTRGQDLSITANYSKKGNFRIPLPILSRKRLENAIDFAITFTLGDNTTEKSKGLGYEISAETSKWILKPTVKYSFSTRVRGGAYFEIGKTHNKLIGDTSFKEFGIDVNISIRGN